MRRVVLFDDYKELEIWPEDTFEKFLNINKAEVKKTFKKNNFVKVDCPACGSKKSEKAFIKFGLKYQECGSCSTLYVSPRPKEQDILRYYKNSQAGKFWQSHLDKQAKEGRTSHMFKPRVMWVATLTDQFLPKADTFMDINTIYNEFLSGIVSLSLFKNVISLNPSVKITDPENIKALHKNLSKNIARTLKADVVSFLAGIDRSFSPEQSLKLISGILKPGGLLFLTGTSSIGFDVRILWDKAKTVFPPDKLNLLSVEGLEILLARLGFEIIEFSTPGKLDVEFVKEQLKKDKNLKVSRFLDYFLKKRDEASHGYFQDLLQKSKLSSHFRITARKK